VGVKRNRLAAFETPDRDLQMADRQIADLQIADL
jgi:hypothetical protein